MANIEKERKLLDELLDEFCSLSTSEEEDVFSNKIKSILASKSEDEKELFSQAFLEGGHQAIQQSEKVIQDVKLRISLDKIYPAVSWSYIASHYFGKSRSWLNQRINEYKVNGEVVTFTPEEKSKLINALKDLGLNIEETAHMIERTL